MVEKLAIQGGSKSVPDGLGKPWPNPWAITNEDRKAVLGALDEAVLAHWSRYLELLQKDWAGYVGTKHCLATNSGTAALHISVAAAGIEPCDEVITSANTFHSSASAVLHQNGIPIFADMDPRTYNIDPKKIEAKITEKTKAIMPVHIAGLTADMDEINAIAKKHDLVVIEDAAQSAGAEYKGKKAGSLGDMAAFSLNANKNLMAGEGGLFNTNNDEYLALADRVRTFGEIIIPGKPRSYDVFGLGWMYKPNAMTAALARSQLIRLDEYNNARIKNSEYLNSKLSKIDGIQTPFVPPYAKHVYNSYIFRLRPKDLGVDINPRKFRDAMEKALNAEGVPVLELPYFVPKQSMYQRKAGYGKGCPWTCPNARRGIKYRAEDYPETMKFDDDHLVFRGGPRGGPWPPNDLRLMEYYVEAFEKIFNNIDVVVALAKKIEG